MPVFVSFVVVYLFGARAEMAAGTRQMSAADTAFGLWLFLTVISAVPFVAAGVLVGVARLFTPIRWPVGKSLWWFLAWGAALFLASSLFCSTFLWWLAFV